MVEKEILALMKFFLEENEDIRPLVKIRVEYDGSKLEQVVGMNNNERWV